MEENRYPIKYLNNKFPGFIGLTLDQIIAVKSRDLLLSAIFYYSLFS